MRMENLLISFVVGVISSLVATWLYDSYLRRGKSCPAGKVRSLTSRVPILAAPDDKSGVLFLYKKRRAFGNQPLDSSSDRYYGSTHIILYGYYNILHERKAIYYKIFYRVLRLDVAERDVHG